jgi:hypothetical protein
MRLWKKKMGTEIARGGLAMLLVLGPVSQAAAQQSPERSGGPVTYSELPDSPGVSMAKLQQSGPSQADPSPTNPLKADPPQTVAQPPSTAPTSATPSQAQPPQPASPPAPKPEGTAAAGTNPATGVAASQPAGMAIAPAKQHRTRTIVLRTGAILGAGAAVGSVVALTQGTSSKPPGAR